MTTATEEKPTISPTSTEEKPAVPQEAKPNQQDSENTGNQPTGSGGKTWDVSKAAVSAIAAFVAGLKKFLKVAVDTANQTVVPFLKALRDAVGTIGENKGSGENPPRNNKKEKNNGLFGVFNPSDLLPNILPSDKTK
jgi:hypothetical protein